MRIPFATNAYKLPSLPISAQECINFYAEREPQDAKTDGQVSVWGCPGTAPLTVIGLGPVRGLNVMNDIAYIVSGSSFYSLTSGSPGTITELGMGIIGTGIVSMSNNGQQVIFVDGAAEVGYIYDVPSLTFQQITDVNFHAADTVIFYDQYFVLNRKGTNQWFFSNILDGRVYSPLDFESAEVQADFVTGVVNQQENLLIFGEKSIETWYDTGQNDNPFQRYDGATIERGCQAPLSIVKEDNSVFFLGDDGIFYRLDGVSPRRVSNHALEAEWQTYNNLIDAFAFSYTFNGHKFINLTFQANNTSWTYDISTNLWHRRTSYDTNGNFFPRWRVNCVTQFLDQLICGDAYTGRVDIMQGNEYTEFGHTMVGVLTSPPIQKDRKRIFLSLFELDIETGIAQSVGADPQLMLDVSRDGGRTYGNLQQWQSMGQIGQYQTRLRWKKLGQAFQFVLRITVSDAVPRRIIGAYGQVSTGM